MNVKDIDDLATDQIKDVLVELLRHLSERSNITETQRVMALAFSDFLCPPSGGKTGSVSTISSSMVNATVKKIRTLGDFGMLDLEDIVDINGEHPEQN